MYLYVYGYIVYMLCVCVYVWYMHVYRCKDTFRNNFIKTGLYVLFKYVF